jgi:hypothetical protein
MKDYWTNRLTIDVAAVSNSNLFEYRVRHA